jgi:hypothetical protein
VKGERPLPRPWVEPMAMVCRADPIHFANVPLGPHGSNSIILRFAEKNRAHPPQGSGDQ